MGQITPHKKDVFNRAVCRAGRGIRINLWTLGRAVCVRLAPVLGVRRAVADRRVAENARDDAGQQERVAAEGQDEVAGGEARGERRREARELVDGPGVRTEAKKRRRGAERLQFSSLKHENTLDSAGFKKTLDKFFYKSSANLRLKTF